jgi:hypothetical protein
VTRWTIRLEGGPYDGDQATIRAFPNVIWAAPCPDASHCDDSPCGGIHWWGDHRPPLDHAAPYERDRETAGVSIYVHAALKADNDRHVRTREKEPIAA